MHNFLLPDVAERLKEETKAADAIYGETIPSQECGEGSGWEIKGPTSKQRYLSLQGPSATPTLNSLLGELIPSEAFRAWLAVVSSLVPTGYRAEARRFRKGLDYTLASGEDASGEARLDCVLGATWWADAVTDEDEDQKLLENGGWEVSIVQSCLADDSAISHHPMPMMIPQYTTRKGSLALLALLPRQTPKRTKLGKKGVHRKLATVFPPSRTVGSISKLTPTSSRHLTLTLIQRQVRTDRC